MKMSKEGIELLKRFEGLRLVAYLCPAKVWTIGYGSTIVNGKPVYQGMEITLEEAEQALREDLDRFEKAVLKYVRIPLKQHQFDALVDFTYNLGIGALKSSTLLKKINAYLLQDAALEFKKWVYAGGKVLPGLVARREAERKLFEGKDA